jgi:hypothetical protein
MNYGPIDITGQRFGSLVAVERAPRPIGAVRRTAWWLCKCDCGGDVVALGCNLRGGKTKYCNDRKSHNRRPAKIKHLSGQRFESWIVLHRVPKPEHAPPTYDHVPEGWWLCECVCGNKRIIHDYKLVAKQTKSCGCLKRGGMLHAA